MKNYIKNKQKLYTLYLKHPNVYNKTTYKNYKNRLSNILHNSERKFYQEQLQQSQGNLRKFWQIIKSIINKKKSIHKNVRFMINGNHIDNLSHIAEAFNNFFINIGQVLDKNIPATPTVPTDFIPQNYIINIFLNPATDSEIDKIISNLKDCACGWDSIPSSVIKDNKFILTPILTHIINNSLLTGTFPAELKIANVIPSFESGNLDEINNYRPVSLLTILSKIYEKVFYSRLINFLKTQKILYQSQYGFREKCSTFMAIVNLLDKIIEALDEGKSALGIFIDFSKAFDTVNHKILLDKLAHYGIRGVANEWVGSNLKDLQQYCTYMGKRSTMKYMKCGVPQG
jgi:hypothetical protein